MRTALPLLPEDWPTEQEASESLWFSPLALRPGCALETRTWVPAMVPWRASEEGFVTQAVLDWYGRFADGAPGALVVEATGIREVPSGPLLRAGHERYLEGLARLCEVVRARSKGRTRLFVQLIDFLSIRRRPERERYFARFLALRPEHREALVELTGNPAFLHAEEPVVRDALAALEGEALRAALSPRELEDLEYGHRERVTDTHLPHLARLPETLPGLFAQAAERCARAGFDGVELHYAHAYTMASFLSRTNDRADGYGGSREGRVRLPVEVLRAVRAAVPERFVVGCRLLGDEVIEGGSRSEDAAWYSVQLAREGIDFVSVSKGGRFEDAKQPAVGHAAYPYTGPSGHECMPTVRIDERGPFGRNLHLAREVRAALRAEGLATPVVAAGGINSFRTAEKALREGDADAVAAARQTLADPDWFAKVRAGRGAEVRRCKYTNYCEALDQLHREVSCQLWDKLRPGDADYDTAPRSADGRRRLVPPAWDRSP